MTLVIAERRSRSIGFAESKLNLPAMPHMSGSRPLGLVRGDDAAARELGRIDGIERRNHAIEGVARPRGVARGGAETRREDRIGHQRGDALRQRLRLARRREQARAAVVDELENPPDAAREFATTVWANA